MGGNWLTLAEVLEDLGVPLEDWRTAQAAGEAPLTLISESGNELIHRGQYERWLDDLTDSEGHG